MWFLQDGCIDKKLPIFILKGYKLLYYITSPVLPTVLESLATCLFAHWVQITDAGHSPAHYGMFIVRLYEKKMSFPDRMSLSRPRLQF